MSGASSAVPKDHPLMVAWEKYSAGEDFANSFRWAAHEEHRQGSMWAAFNAGWLAAKGQACIDFTEKVAALAEPTPGETGGE